MQSGQYMFIKDFAEEYGLKSSYIHHLIKRGLIHSITLAELQKIDPVQAMRLGRGKSAQNKVVVFKPDGQKREDLTRR